MINELDELLSQTGKTYNMNSDEPTRTKIITVTTSGSSTLYSSLN